MTLTPKQQRFVEEYLVDFNATRAAIRAGYSERTAEQQAYQLLQKSSVREVVEAGKAKLAKLTLITAEEVVAGLRREADYHGEGASHRCTSDGYFERLWIDPNKTSYSSAVSRPRAKRAMLTRSLNSENRVLVNLSL